MIILFTTEVRVVLIPLSKLRQITFISSSFQLKLPLPCVLLLLISFLHCLTVGLNSRPTVYSILLRNAFLHRYTYHTGKCFKNLFKRIKLFVNDEFNSSVGQCKKRRVLLKGTSKSYKKWQKLSIPVISLNMDSEMRVNVSFDGIKYLVWNYRIVTTITNSIRWWEGTKSEIISPAVHVNCNIIGMLNKYH